MVSSVKSQTLYSLLYRVSQDLKSGYILINLRSNISLLCVILLLLAWGFSSLKSKGIDLSLSGLRSLGFGTTNQYSVISVDPIGPPETVAIIANVPQLFLSIFTLEYQNSMKTMFVAHEWNRYGFKGQALQVSGPAGNQLGTWLLNMPFGFGFVILLLNTLFHWVISRSLFVIVIKVNSEDTSQDVSSVLTNCGYSPIAVIVTVLLLLLLIVIVTVISFRKFRSDGPPIVSTSSMAISASCHPYPYSPDLPFKRLRWGAAPFYQDNVGHCSLLAEDQWTHAPVPGYRYR
jgi:hypothetical protein